MNKHIIGIIGGIFFIGFQSLFAQNNSSGTVYTPNKSRVVYIDRTNEEFSLAEIEEQTNYTRTTYPQAVILSPATRTYNCHSYAWYLSEGGTDKVWINSVQNGVANLEKYWTDGSYVECSSSEARKIHYYEGDHSAIPAGSGLYESKWGALPLVRHAPDYVPYSYVSDYRRYYRRSYIVGNYSAPGSSGSFATSLPNDHVEINVRAGGSVRIDLLPRVAVNESFRWEMVKEASSIRNITLLNNGCQIETKNLGKTEIFQYKASIMPARSYSVTFVIYIEGNTFYEVKYTPGSSFLTIKKNLSETDQSTSLAQTGGTESICSMYVVSTGSLVKEIRLSDPTINQVDVSSLENNVYTLVIREQGEVVYQTKLHIRK